MTYHDLVKKAKEKLADSDVSENTAKLLMFELLNEQNKNMYVIYDDEVDEETAERYDAAVERLLKDEPLAYILGYQWFYGRKFRVHKEVFIPRYETEELCGNVLALIDEYYPENEVVVADVACGSGAIGLTIKAEEPRVKVYLTDLSTEAVNTARLTAKDNDIDATFFTGDLLEPLKKENIKLDILICNPPYILDDEILDNSVKDYEPHMALFGGKDGLDFYRRLLKEAREVIKEKAIIAFEIGYNQRQNLIDLANEYFPDDRCEVLKDINGKDRMFFLYYNL